MKKAIIFLSCVLCPILLAAQKTEWYECRTDTIPYEVTVAIENGKLTFTGRTQIDSTDFLPYISPFSLLDADIVFTSRSLSKFKRHTRDSIKILSIRQKGEKDGKSPASDNVIVEPSLDQKNVKQYAILDAMEDYLEYGKTYVIDIERSFYTDFDPNETIPKINYGWYVGAAGLGIGAIAYGINLRMESNDALDNYEANWRNGLSKEVSQNFYDDAEKKNDLSYIAMGAGVLVLAADVALFVINRNKWKKRHTLNTKIKEKTKKDISLHLCPSDIIGSNAVGWKVGAAMKF